MEYPYSKANVDLSKLQGELLAAGLPITNLLGGAIGSPDFTVVTLAPLSAQQVATMNSVIAAHDGRKRTPRPLLTLYQAVNALTTAQKNAINADLFGADNKWGADVGPNRGSLFVLYLLTQLGLSAAQTTAAKLAAAAMYVQDNPAYLTGLNPPIDIPGDAPVG